MQACRLQTCHIDRDTMLEQAEPFLRAIAENPGDQLQRLIFADWLSERGFEGEAAGQRWAAKYGKYPASKEYIGQGGWYWNLTHAPVHCRLGLCRFPKSSKIIMESSGCDLVNCEILLLEFCGQLEWDQDGEPIG